MVYRLHSTSEISLESIREMIVIFTIFLFKSLLVHGHVPKNTSDTIVTYAGHADAERDHVVIMDKPKTDCAKGDGSCGKKSNQQQKQDIIHQEEEHLAQDRIHLSEHELIVTTVVPPMVFMTEKEEMVFIPNDNIGGIETDDEYLSSERHKSLGDIFDDNKRTLDEIVRGKGRVENDPPKDKDTIFLSGKNNENEEEVKREHRKEAKRMEKKTNTNKIVCSKLDCNNSFAPVCGGKMESNRMKYRRFLNECYFNKVNCGFSYDSNKYREVLPKNCLNFHIRNTERPFFYNPAPPMQQKKKHQSQEAAKEDTRRSFTFRRSLSLGVDGQMCTHPCPASCPDDYEPECAISATGQKRVFVNHCSLDYNSCLYSVVWHQRPLADCVGDKMADFRQNRGFIGWMQNIGIIDSKGRLRAS